MSREYLLSDLMPVRVINMVFIYLCYTIKLQKLIKNVNSVHTIHRWDAEIAQFILDNSNQWEEGGHS